MKYRHKIRDYILLEDIFLFLLHNVGNMTSIPSIIKYFKSRNRKSDYGTISQYISYMRDAFIIHEAPRYFLKTKEILSGEKKYFVTDMGFRNYLYPNLINDIGAILENISFMHLRIAGFALVYLPNMHTFNALSKGDSDISGKPSNKFQL